MLDNGGEAIVPGSMTESGWRDPRWAARAFGLAVVVAGPLILYLNRNQWFFYDEWQVLTTRQLSSPASLLRPHNEHLFVLPAIMYQVVFRLVGLHHYWPYQVFTVAAHLIAALLLRVVMRRAGVSPWLATLAATAFVYYGTGRENVGWAFQVGFTGSLAFGIAHILLADHDGPTDRRDALGIGCGVLAIMCSSIGLTMVLAVSTAVLIRRGWRPALFHASLPGLVYVAWFVGFGESSSKGIGASPSQLFRFAAGCIWETLSGLGQGWVAGAALALCLVLGTGARLARFRDRDDRAAYAVTAGLLVGAVSFIALAGYGRAMVSLVPASRYMHLIAAMVIPAIALAATDLARYWRVTTVAVGALLLVGLPGNIRALEPSGKALFTLGPHDVVLAMAATPTPPGSPRSMRPLPLVAPGMTLGWLRDASAAGRVPPPRAGSPMLEPTMSLALSIEQVSSEPGGPCTAQRGRGPITLKRGEMLRVRSTGALVNGAGPLVGAHMDYYTLFFIPQVFDRRGRPEVRLLVAANRVQLSVSGVDPGSPVVRCAAR